MANFENRLVSFVAPLARRPLRSPEFSEKICGKPLVAIGLTNLYEGG
jgi:hypothetical protein